MMRRKSEQERLTLLRSQIRWQKITSLLTLCLAASAFAAIAVAVYYNTRLIRESVETRVAENRPLIDLRRYPLSARWNEGMHVEIKNVGKGNAYNINYSYYYYDWSTGEIFFESRTAVSGAECFTVLQPGAILSRHTDHDRARLKISEPDGLPYIRPLNGLDRIRQMHDSTAVACAVYVEYEDFKGNIFWTARQFPVKVLSLGGLNIWTKPWPGDPADAPGSFLRRGRERAVKTSTDFVKQKRFDRRELIQTEKLEDTLLEPVLK